jgi:pimeloyl-ACP methyl ester carboxylesterase
MPDPADHVQVTPDALRAVARDGPRSHNVVLGHSYGTTLIGHAAHHERLDVDDVVLLGSPGLGAAVGSAKDLNLPPEHVHASTAENDMIKNTNNPDSYNDPVALGIDPLGRDPADPRFGGHVFSSDPGPPGGLLGSTEAHSEYWEPWNRSLANMGRIIAGQPTS